jgi:hypothetical protein
MSIVYNTEGIDDTYSQEIIAKARELSKELDDYVVSQQYLLEVDADEVDPLWLRNRLIAKVVEQLADAGIAIELEHDRICDDVRLTKTALVLREKFDVDTFTEFLKTQTEIKAVVEVNLEAEDLLGKVIEICHDLLPLDEGWEVLSDSLEHYPGMIHGTEQFSEMVEDALDATDRLGTEDSVSVVGDLASVADYVGYLGKRKRKIAALAKVMYDATNARGNTGVEDFGSSEAADAAVETYMRNFEVELARPDVVEHIGDKETTEKLINSVRERNSVKWRHTLTHWISEKFRDSLPNELDIAVMVATMFVDVGSESEARVKVIEIFESVAENLGDRYEKVRNMFDDALANLVVYQEQGGMINA